MKRKFNGPLNAKADGISKGFTGDVLKDYCNMQYKHLRAYLRGDKTFFHKKMVLEVDQTIEDGD